MKVKIIANTFDGFEEKELKFIVEVDKKNYNKLDYFLNEILKNAIFVNYFIEDVK